MDSAACSPTDLFMCLLIDWTRKAEIVPGRRRLRRHRGIPDNGIVTGREEDSMKRVKVVAVVIVLLAGSLSLLAGCGGDTGRAKEYMKEGDKIQAELATGSSELATSMPKARANVTDAAAMQKAAEDVKALTADLDAKADKAIAEFEKIEGLSGVEDYKEYAALEIEADKVTKNMLVGIDKFLDELEAMASSGDATEEQVAKATETYRQDLGESIKKMMEVETEAVQLKKDKKL
jgi:hypothetical protein